MKGIETSIGKVRPNEAYFNPEGYLDLIYQARDYISERWPCDFTPQVALTLGSGGLGEVAEVIYQVADPIPYNEIPGFRRTTVEGHAGNLVAGNIGQVPVVGFQGRRHFYEVGGQPNQVIALKEITFPVYVARALGAELYFATNAAGGLNPDFAPGDLMIIKSHLDLFFPNPLLGPQVDFGNPPRFQPQHEQYNPELRRLLRQATEEMGEERHLHEGVYCALTGPTYESQADSRALRRLGVDAVGMSTVPEVIVATNIGMETFGLSLITNVIGPDGTNATSHEEVMAALQDETTRGRVVKVTSEFFRFYGIWRRMSIEAI